MLFFLLVNFISFKVYSLNNQPHYCDQYATDEQISLLGINNNLTYHQSSRKYFAAEENLSFLSKITSQKFKLQEQIFDHVQYVRNEIRQYCLELNQKKSQTNLYSPSSVIHFQKYLFNGYRKITKIKCSISLPKNILRSIENFVLECKSNRNCLFDIENARKIKNSAFKKTLRYISKIRYLENYESEILPSIYSQLKKISPRQNFSLSTFLSCFNKLDSHIYSDGIHFTLSQKKECTKKEIYKKLSRNQKLLLQKIKDLSKNIEKDSTSSCYDESLPYSCNERADCLRQFFKKNGHTDLSFFYLSHQNQLVDTKRKNTPEYNNLFFYGTEYSFHSALSIDIGGVTFIIDPNVKKSIENRSSVISLSEWRALFSPSSKIAAVYEDYLYSSPIEATSDDFVDFEKENFNISCSGTKADWKEILER